MSTSFPAQYFRNWTSLLFSGPQAKFENVSNYIITEFSGEFLATFFATLLERSKRNNNFQKNVFLGKPSDITEDNYKSNVYAIITLNVEFFLATCNKNCTTSTKCFYLKQHWRKFHLHANYTLHFPQQICLQI